MSLYCGIDLHSSNSFVAVLDEEYSPQLERRLRNDLGAILECLEPFRSELVGVAVESTFNWYWLVDGLMESGYKVHLVNTSAVKQYEGLKYTDDRHDARWLARLLALDILPTGYIYPKGERPVRDLLRRRAFLVRKRVAMYLAMKGLYQRQTGRQISTNEIKRWDPSAVRDLLADPREALAITSMLCVANTLTDQITGIEEAVVAEAKLRPEFELLRTVRGIGEAIALTIMYETGDIHRFKKVGNFASYCRCVRTDRISNNKRKGKGNKRNGNPYLSWAFTEAAHFAVRFEPLAKRFFDRKTADTNKVVAIRALAHKLARACYYILRDQVPFEPRKAFG